MDRLVRITTSVEQKKRDDYGRAVARGLRSHGFFQHVPLHIVRGYASLHGECQDAAGSAKRWPILSKVFFGRRGKLPTPLFFNQGTVRPESN